MKIHKALEFAAIKHEGQKRKAGNVPYIAHPAEVMYLLTKAGADQDTVVAGILHDCIEDAGVTKQEIAELFGDTVAFLVDAESEDKTKRWSERKQHTVNFLATAPLNVKMIAAADKISNLKSILHALESGVNIFERFTGDYVSVKNYYLGIVNALNCNTAGESNPLFSELRQWYEKVFELPITR